MNVVSAWDEANEVHNDAEYKASFREYKGLALQGFARAQFNLGHMYHKGEGTVQDYEAAFNWYMQAAEQGVVNAQFNLALMNVKGEGVAQNYIRAYMWWDIVASNGDKDAKNQRNLIQKSLTFSQLVKARELVKECQAKSYRDC